VSDFETPLPLLRPVNPGAWRVHPLVTDSRACTQRQ
jgi:hypothetical protein